MAEGIIDRTVCDMLPGYKLGVHSVFPVGASDESDKVGVEGGATGD